MPPPAPTSGPPRRSRRIEDALSQLVDSIVPPPPHDDPDADTDEAAATAAAAHRRRRHLLDRAWRTIDARSQSGTGGGPSAALNPDVVNTAPDLIKRKLLRENASPDKAVRFSNLYSRLLTQPVLGQKWAILYLLLRIGELEGESESDEDHRGVGIEDGGEREDGNEEEENDAVAAAAAAADELRRRERAGLGVSASGRRSPLLEEHQLESMLLKRAAGLHRGVSDSSVRPESPTSQPTAASARGNGPSLAPSTRLGSQRPAPSRGKMSRQPTEEPESRPPHGEHRQSKDSLSTTASAAPGASRPPPPPPPSEPALLRDLPFCLQGLSTKNLEFSSPTTLKLPRNLPVPLISLLHTLAEPCLLYRKLSAFVEQPDGGLVEQSLKAAIGSELRSYLGLVATLEGEIRTALTAASKAAEAGSEAADPKAVMKAGVTLKRCVVWMRDATMALRLMSLMVEEAQGKKGGQLISVIHGFSTGHGDPFVGAFAEKLLGHMTRPFYGMLTQWIYDGELSDPYHEFFVVQPEARPNMDPRRTATSVWDEKYKLDDDMVPTIMNHEFAKKVFLIGKSLNFIRYGCGDAAWVVAYSRDASKELRYADTATLETSIDEAYKTTMARLIHLMDTQFKLFDHLNALKKYLLLGQGDFIALLMESLASNLDRPANSQYRHTLTAQLEHAIRASNAQYDSPDVLRRLDARMLELSHGEIGWDCFTLEYKIDAPVDVIITPWASTQYLKVFNFLWRVKRVEFALVTTWRRCTTGARGVLGSVQDKVGPDWKRARCVMAEMIHFVSQLQYYILFEVIESSWDQLQLAISKPGCTLDDLIEAHTKYLNAITHKGLLGSASSKPGAPKEDSFLSQLHHILKLMLAYKDAVDGLYSFSVAEFTRRQELSAKIETRTAQGRWGITDKDMQPSTRGSHRQTTGAGTPNQFLDSSLSGGGTSLDSEDHLLPSLRSRLQELSADFRARLVTLLSNLAYQPDVDMRFLGVVMNFNDVYQVVRRKRGGTSAGKEKKRSHQTTASTGDAAAAS